MTITKAETMSAQHPTPLYAIRVTSLRRKHKAARWSVSSMEDAADKWSAFRQQSMAGCSQIGNGVIVIDGAGALVGSVSYNGRIWAPNDDARRALAKVTP